MIKVDQIKWTKPEAVREGVRQMITEHLEPMIKAQIANAVMPSVSGIC